VAESQPIESYALIGDMQTAALVSRTGSVDWLCFPRFDSDACFAALLGEPDDGCWRLAPDGAGECNRRRYRHDSLILETEWETVGGAVRVIDFMPPRGEAPDIVRIVQGISGRVEMTSDLRLRFDYGAVRPWIREVDNGFMAVAGPDSVHLRASVPVTVVDHAHISRFTVSAGDTVSFVLTWEASFREPPKPVRADRALRDTEKYWSKWVGRCEYDGEWRDAVVRSMITLKALTYSPTGGLVAAATTSLPEALGADRNWDYRYCWLRDASVTLEAMVTLGYRDEARAWREWLLRALAGDPEKLRIMYGLSGERRLPETDLKSLKGYAGSQPVRIGNLASEQFQLDVYGEVLDLLHLDRCEGLTTENDAWQTQLGLLDVLESRWQEPDQGLWEMRGDPRQFVHSKVMAWVGFDRAVRAVEHFGLDGPVERWRALRDQVHQEVCEKGFDDKRNTFTQSYGSKALDAALLLIPQVGFLPGDDPRIVGTVDALCADLMRDGFLMRYDKHADDGFDSEEGTFLACTIWLADDLDLIGRETEAREVFERVLDIRNDVGLLSEEYDPVAKRQVGNVPQAYSHVALVNTALNLNRQGDRRGRQRAQRGDEDRAG
jgi:GH15 family glucan-1,4-alpha-glucosidase